MIKFSRFKNKREAEVASAQMKQGRDGNGHVSRGNQSEYRISNGRLIDVHVRMDLKRDRVDGR